MPLDSPLVFNLLAIFRGIFCTKECTLAKRLYKNKRVKRVVSKRHGTQLPLHLKDLLAKNGVDSFDLNNVIKEQTDKGLQYTLQRNKESMCPCHGRVHSNMDSVLTFRGSRVMIGCFAAGGRKITLR